MNSQNLIIYDYNLLYLIFEELNLDLNFNIIEVENQKQLQEVIKKKSNYLIITKKKNFQPKNNFSLENLPIKISKLVEKINIEFIKQQFNNQSKVTIKNYIIDLNSREMSSKNNKLKLTEKEVNTIIYLSNNNKTVSINELQKHVWDYQSDLETHTVETHIYRLRKKILVSFNDDKFIISKKNGYQII
tara:strand:+ start:456 stop:1019 length:564 start_codon:yes stop_codon:yes gene_type:complete